MLTFGALGVVCALYALNTALWPLRLLLLWVALAWCGVSAAYAGLGPNTFLKRADGRLALLSYGVFWPYYALNVVSLWFYRCQRGGHLWDLVAPNVYLGGVLTKHQAQRAKSQGVASVLDVTSEWSTTRGWTGAAYKTLPVLDTRAPTSSQLREGAQWLQEATRRGPVYVHCALGHGRSATFVAAYLMLSGQVTGIDEAIATLKAKRPAVTISPPQFKVLWTFETELRRTKQDGTTAHMGD